MHARNAFSFKCKCKWANHFVNNMVSTKATQTQSQTEMLNRQRTTQRYHIISYKYSQQKSWLSRTFISKLAIPKAIIDILLPLVAISCFELTFFSLFLRRTPAGAQNSIANS